MAGVDPAANLAEALLVLKHLESIGTLSADNEDWIAKIEAALAKTR
jgi:hypothetical protein